MLRQKNEEDRPYLSDQELLLQQQAELQADVLGDKEEQEGMEQEEEMEQERRNISMEHTGAAAESVMEEIRRTENSGR